MPTYTVADSGADYTTIADAHTAASDGDTIEVQSATDFAGVTITKGITLISTGSAKHDGYQKSTPDYARIRSTSGHVITINAAGKTITIDGFVIVQGGTGASDECIRITTMTLLTVKNCIIYSESITTDQDGIYLAGGGSNTLTVENCFIYGFERCGIHKQASNTGSPTFNIRSCGFVDCGHSSGTGDDGGGGVGIKNTIGGANITANIDNCWALNNTSGTGDNADFFQALIGGASEATIDWTFNNCIVSDTSFTDIGDTATGTTESATLTDNASPGAGDYVVVQNITSSPYDYRLKTSVDNDAQDAHTVSTNLPTVDIVGTARPQNTNWDIGPYEIEAGGGGNRRRRLLVT